MSRDGRGDDERGKEEDGTMLKKNAPVRPQKHNKYLAFFCDLSLPTVRPAQNQTIILL